MRIIRADPWYRLMSKEEVEEFLSKPLLLRLGLIDEDNYPIVHPVWFLYDEEFTILSNKGSKKVRILRNNPRVYFTIDEDKPSGVRGKGDARLIDGDASKIMREMLIKYGIDLNSNVGKQLMEEAKDSVIIRIKPKFLATWVYE